MKLFFSLLATLAASPAHAGGTVVGNGGDPVFEFLEAARASMVSTLKILATDKKESAGFCEKPDLKPEQAAFCRDYFLELVPEILQLAQRERPVPFVLREEPLYVDGPDGKPMVVAARTALGPEGPIELHRDSVKNLLPTQVLFLLTHEFQHKASFRGHPPEDNSAIGPFALGRELIDLAATSVVTTARRKGQIGMQFGIRDLFVCVVTAGNGQFGAQLSSPRLFRSEDLMAYETSVGRNPTDGSVFVPEGSSSSLVLRFAITEPNNCGDTNPLRRTEVKIVRVKQLSDGSRAESVVAAQESAVNPICPGADPALEIETGPVRFSCRYTGSEGTTISPVYLAKPQSKLEGSHVTNVDFWKSR